MNGIEPIELDELRAVEAELNTRWPETKIAPSTARIAALLSVLGDPHRSFPCVQIAGTNGKTSVARMVDSLLTRLGLRVGRYTSPHLQLATERISIDGSPISPEGYVEAFRDIAPYVSMVDAQGDIAMTKFEVLTGMAFAAFADAPVEAAVLEVGMGGSWDATNVVDAQVAVVGPIGVDHTEHLGSELTAIAKEKAGIIKPGSVALLANQHPDVERVLLERCVEVDATVARQGHEFGVLEREVAVGGQQLRLQGLGGVYEEIFLPLHGEHQADNAARALAAAEAFFGAGADKQLNAEAVAEAFAQTETPGRMERVRAAPTVLVDAAHNPDGARALSGALSEEFAFRKLNGVIAILEDKDARGILDALEPVLSEVVITRNSSPRCMDVDALAQLARSAFGEERVIVEPSLDDAVTTAIQLSEQLDEPEAPMAGSGVVITGSVVTAGEARALFGKEPA
ncbi:MAG: dihydrofolate synthase [Pseudonocardiaceae bacterium]|nr:dihydrofolate synthase [Pseudonocardiaceae bacterium]